MDTSRTRPKNVTRRGGPSCPSRHSNLAEPPPDRCFTSVAHLPNLPRIYPASLPHPSRTRPHHGRISPASRPRLCSAAPLRAPHRTRQPARPRASPRASQSRAAARLLAAAAVKRRRSRVRATEYTTAAFGGRLREGSWKATGRRRIERRRQLAHCGARAPDLRRGREGRGEVGEGGRKVGGRRRKAGGGGVRRAACCAGGGGRIPQ